MNIVWDGEFRLISPSLGTLLLNTDLGDGRNYRLNGKRCVGRRGIRASNDNLPQGDGEVFHARYATGSEMQLAIQLWDGEEIACDDVLAQMYDDLRGWLWSLLRPAGDGGRLVWTPPGKAARMLDAARLFSISDPEEDQDTGAIEIIAVLDSVFPYAIAETQSVVNINGLAGSITNNGNVDFWPVIKVYTDGVTIVNNTTGLNITIGSGGLGGGSYIELDTFRNTAYVDGDQANAKPWIDPQQTDFFPLVPGVNQIDTNGSCDFLVNDAWA